MGVRLGFVLGELRECRAEGLGTLTPRERGREGGGRGAASGLSSGLTLEGTEETCVAGGADPPPEREEALPGQRRPPPPRERGSLSRPACSGGGGEETAGPTPVWAPLKGGGVEELHPNPYVRFPYRWCAVVVLAAFPSLGAGGETPEAPPESWTQLWFFRFLVNAAGYASFMVPGYLLVQYFRRKNYLETGRGLCFPLVKACVFGNEPKASDEVPLAPRTEAAETTPMWQALKLLFCATGLQVSYLTWGVLQERVMTRSYGATATSPGERFTDSQFLVLMNRVLALIVAGLSCVLCKQPRHGAPMYRYSFASLSNVLSSWCQYEALKFVSFPTQVLAKASKVIPVMLMGKLVSRRSYEHWEYLTATLISIGVSMFLLSSGPEPRSSPATTLSGLVLLAGYIAFDSFTSNWQDALFAYKMSSVQMMFGVNFFSCLFTVGSLLEQGALLEGTRFMGRHSEFAAHALLLSICSACGQLFIFYTIGQFGAAVFTIIMTLRQAFAILLSCLLYGHTVTVVGGLGVAVVFAALLLRVYARGRLKQRGKKAVPVESPVQKV
uniref:Adenosine 3'-phospho 5'-phosphosulfate transporter 1 n=1 Tax=Aotus nancymaae TaxID=37293 RepID=A0A2K5E047_AOTNA